MSYTIPDFANSNLVPDVLPIAREVVLKVTTIGNRTLIDHSCIIRGKKTHRSVTINSIKERDILLAKTALIQKVDEENSSFKLTGPLFEELVDLYMKSKKTGETPWVFSKIRERFLGFRVNDEFANEFDNFVREMESRGLSTNTIANHKSAIQTVLRYAKKKRRLKDVPIPDFEIERTYRSRIWIDDKEREKFFNTLELNNSHFYWAARLLSVRPMRAYSDLYRLTDDNFVSMGEDAPYITYFQTKINKKGKEQKRTIIPLHSHPEIVDYLKHGRPTGCPLLFPRIAGRRLKSVRDFEFMRNCNWKPMGDPKNHFKKMLYN